MMSDDSDGDILTPSEMVHLLAIQLTTYGKANPDDTHCMGFFEQLEQFSGVHEEFMCLIDEVLVSSVYYQYPKLTHMLLWRYTSVVELNHRSVTIPGGHTPLTTSVTHGYTQLMETLVNMGADIFVTSESGEFVLDKLCERNDTRGVEYILDIAKHHQATRQWTKMVASALMTSCRHGLDDLVKTLISRGVSVNIIEEGEERDTALHCAIEAGHMTTVDLLLESGSDVESLRHPILQTPLMLAAQVGHVTIIRRLLAEGVNVNRMTSECSSALTLACHYGQTEAVKCLIDAAADVNHVNTWGYTPLFMGADTPDIVKELLKGGARVDSLCGERGEAAVHLAAVIGSRDSMTSLLDGGCDLDLLTSQNETALWLAVWAGHMDICRILLENNCRVGVASHSCHVYAYEYTELEVAMGKERFDLMRMLLLAGCPVRNHVYYPQQTPGPLDDLQQVRLRKEPLVVLQRHPEEFRWFRFWVSNPRSLKQMCRKTVRFQFDSSLARSLKLSVPCGLLDYVCFKDIIMEMSDL